MLLLTSSIIFVLVAIAAAIVRVDRLGRRIGSAADRLLRRAWVAPLLAGLTSLCIGVIPLLMHAVPPPTIHDEFSYLLAAETFAHGRLTNPTPKLWQHFETVHELMQPTYMSKFPPGQGLALAVGMRLGAPIIGAFGVIALACAAVTWMLRGWMPPRWALLGGLSAALHPMIISWGQSYWGGGVAMLGGALLGGGFVRIARRIATKPTASICSSAIAVGVGAAILAGSRPFEGVILVLAMATVLLARAYFADRIGWLVRSLAPSVPIILAALAWLAYYNHRVTGHALTPPYVEHARQYFASPLFWWDPVPIEPRYNSVKLRQVHAAYERDVEYASQCTFKGQMETLWLVAHSFVDPPFLLLPLACAVAAVTRSRLVRTSLGMFLGVLLIERLTTPWLRMHYLGVVAGFFFALVAQGVRQLARQGRLGAALAAAVMVTQLIAAAGAVRATMREPRAPGRLPQQITEHLLGVPGKHLVFVHYVPGPQLGYEWVYNAADIDAARIVWARADTPDDVAKLSAAFPGRKHWVLDVAQSEIDLREVVPP